MDLTVVAAASLVFAGVGYAFVQRAPRPRLLVWSLLCASLFALATRDLFRPRERGPPRPDASEASPSDAPTDLPARTDADGRRRPPLRARLRSRIAGWFS